MRLIKTHRSICRARLVTKSLNLIPSVCERVSGCLILCLSLFLLHSQSFHSSVVVAEVDGMALSKERGVRLVGQREQECMIVD